MCRGDQILFLLNTVHIHLQHLLWHYMCCVLIIMIFVSLFFCHYINTLCYCGHVCLCTWPSLCFSCMCAWYVCLHMCVCVYVYVLSHYPLMLPPTRVPGGEFRQWGSAGWPGHPWDQCDSRGRRANAQWRLPAATPWRPRPVWWRNFGSRLWGQPGLPRSWLWHAGSGGQEAEVCEANGGEWGFWVSLHREEPVLRSFPLPHSWGNLGNCVWGRGLKRCMMTSPI